MADESLWILGAGGHAKVAIATARAMGFTSIVVADDDSSRLGTTLLGARVDATVREVLASDRRAVLAIGDNRVRHDLSARARCQFVTLVHPSAVVDPSVTLGEGTLVFAGCVIQPDTRLGAHCIVNTGASIDHDCRCGDAVHIAPGARVAGDVFLGEGVFMGIGSAITPGRRIGAWTTIGAGAVVVRDLPAGVTAVGVPARARLT